MPVTKDKMTASHPAMIITPELLDTVRSQPNLPADVWYLIVATALCVLNRPEEISAVFTHAVGKGHGSSGFQNGAEVAEPEQLRIARRMREALLKTSAIGGLPKVGTQQEPRGKTLPPPSLGEAQAPSED